MSRIELVNTKVQLQRFPGKGGWTYAPLPSVPFEKKNAFGWAKVNGFIDDYRLTNHSVMPMSNGMLFFAVRAEIRKAIKKQAGDTVHIRLFMDDANPELPGDISAAFSKQKKALQFFEQLAAHNRSAYLNYVNAACDEKDRKKRIGYMMDELTSERIMRSLP
jgi:hypothetical protein